MNNTVSSLLETLISDLAAESIRLRGRVATLDADDWGIPTPAPGWTIAHQIAHLTWTDEAACTAIEDPDAFAELVAKAAADPATFVDDAADELLTEKPGDLLDRWDAGRARLSQALHRVPDGARISWYGPPMSASSMATARLMETWAHGHDVAEALGVSPAPTARAKHVAYLGVRTRDFAYHVNARTPPAEEFRVELTGPGGEVWAWGPKDATDRVTGSGHDFALLVTRRRHPHDVDVHAEGEQAALWLTIAQAFAGLPGPDPVRLADRRARA